MKHFIFTFLLFAHSLLFAQDGKITGKVLDSKGLAVSAATVMVLSGETVVNGAITDDQGVFNVQPVDSGTYKVKIEYLFCKKEITGVTVLSGSTRDLGIIQLQENTVIFDEVAITEFREPVFEKSREQGMTFDAKEVRNLGTRDVRKVAAITPGVYSGDKGGELVVSVKDKSPEKISDETNKSELKAKKKKGNSKQELEPINTENYSLIVENQFKSPSSMCKCSAVGCDKIKQSPHICGK